MGTKEQTAMVSKFINEFEETCEYYFEHGLRKVTPYQYTFQSFAKARWQGRKLIEVMRREFHDLSEAYYLEAIRTGRLLVNHKKVSPDYVFKNGDLMLHRIHRHEPPVTEGMPEIVNLTKAHGGDGSAMELDGFTVEGEGVPDQLVMVNKPSSIPVHPSGRYHHNSMTRILHATHPELFPHKNGVFTKVFPCNRLDRLTSGLLVMALNAERAREFEGHFSGRKVGKWYVCRVLGDFPARETTVDAPILVYEHKLSLNCVSPNGKPAVTVFEKLSYNGHTSVVRCRPLTGRTHQIRVHVRYLGFPIANDPIYAHRFWDEETPKLELEPFGDNMSLRNEEPLARRVAERMREAAGGNRLGGWNFEGADDDTLKGPAPAVDGATQSSNELSEAIAERADSADVRDVCADCKDPKSDPLPDQLGIWLHAIQYEFPSSHKKTGKHAEEPTTTWTVRSPMPHWAEAPYSDDRRVLQQLDKIWRERFAVFAD